jgi:hypothetical protein
MKCTFMTPGVHGEIWYEERDIAPMPGTRLPHNGTEYIVQTMSPFHTGDAAAAPAAHIRVKKTGAGTYL